MFLGTFENKVDRKGRVSVPASFRQSLATDGIVAFNSYRSPAIEACDTEFIGQMINSVKKMPMYSDDQEDLAFTIFSDSQKLPFGEDGRIILPEKMMLHAGITDRAAFVGKGSIFQIWEPDALERHKTEARMRAKYRGLTLTLQPTDSQPPASGGDGQ